MGTCWTSLMIDHGVRDQEACPVSVLDCRVWVVERILKDDQGRTVASMCRDSFMLYKIDKLYKVEIQFFDQYQITVLLYDKL